MKNEIMPCELCGKEPELLHEFTFVGDKRIDIPYIKSCSCACFGSNLNLWNEYQTKLKVYGDKRADEVIDTIRNLPDKILATFEVKENEK